MPCELSSLPGNGGRENISGEFRLLRLVGPLKVTADGSLWHISFCVLSHCFSAKTLGSVSISAPAEGRVVRQNLISSLEVYNLCCEQNELLEWNKNGELYYFFPRKPNTYEHSERHAPVVVLRHVRRYVSKMMLDPGGRKHVIFISMNMSSGPIHLAKCYQCLSADQMMNRSYFSTS